MKKKEQKQTKPQSNGLIFLVCLVVGIAGLFYLVSRHNAPRPTKQGTMKTATPRKQSHTMSSDEMLKVVKESAKDVPDAESLASFMEQNANYGVLVGDNILTTNSATGALSFTVVQATRDDVTRLFGSKNAIAYDREQDLLLVPDGDRFTQPFFGAMILHELKHAFDVKHELLAVHATPDEIMRGEIRAYRVELAVLDHAFNGRVRELIKDILVKYSSAERETCFLLRDRPLSEKKRFNDLFPPTTYDIELMYRVVLLPIFMNLISAEQANTNPITCVTRLLEDQDRRMNGQ